MHLPRLPLAGLSLVVILNLLSGCILIKSASYKNGLKYLEAQSYDQAVEMLSIAAHEDPKNAEIAADLKRAKKLAANHDFQLGEQLSRQDKIGSALEKFQKAKIYQPDNFAYANRFNQEKTKYDQITRQIEMAMENISDPAQWDVSLKTLEELKIYESSFPSLSKNIEVIRKTAAAYHESKSDQALKSRRYQKAYQEMAQALSYSAEERLIRKKEALNHLLQAEGYWRDKQYSSAHDEIMKALELEPGQAYFEEYRDRFFTEWAGVLYNEAVAANNDGDYAKAKAKLTHLLSFKPWFLNSEEMLKEISSTLASTYYEKAEKILNTDERSRVGTALIYYLLVKQENPELYSDIEDKINQTKKLLGKELEQRISLQFENKSEEPGAGSMVTEQILSKIKNSKGLRHVTILDRASIDSILREQGLGQGFLDESTSLTVKKIKGIQLGVRGEVIKLSVKETGRDRPSYGSKRYKSGSRWLPNPDYMTAQQEVQIAQQGVLQAQQELNNTIQQQKQIAAQRQSLSTSSNKAQQLNAFSGTLGQLAISMAQGKVNKANNNMTNASMRLATTPQMIEEDTFSDYRYEIFDLTLKGEAVLSFKIISYTTSEISEVHTVRKELMLKDRYVPGDPGKNVISDPIDFPPKDEIKNNLLNQAVDELFDKMAEELSRTSQNYYRLAKRSSDNGITDDAVEYYLRYVYSAPRLNDQRVQEAKQYIYDRFGLRVVR